MNGLSANQKLSTNRLGGETIEISPKPTSGAFADFHAISSAKT